MKFRSWMETEGSLGSMNLPTLPDPNRGSDTPASDEVKRTGLQPQVDSDDIETKPKDEQDKVQAIDGALQRCDKEIPQGKSDSKKVNKFNKLWKKLKTKWEDLKMQTPPDNNPDQPGLGTETGDQKQIKTMQQFPNMIPVGPDKFPSGPGTFGMS